MFSKLTLLAVMSVAVAAPQHHTAAQFPAGVDPSKCPDFPICDNAVLHSPQSNSAAPAPSSWNQQPQQQWNQPKSQQWNQPQSQSQWDQPQPQSQWNQPQSQSQWNQPQAQPQPQWNQHQAQPQQQWNQQQPQSQWNEQSQPKPSWNSAPYQAPSNHLSGSQQSRDDDINGAGGDKYPAGVNPQSCPNYPYCT